MAGRRVVPREQLAERRDEALRLAFRANAPSHLADLVFNVCWNATGVPGSLRDDETLLEDLGEALELIDEVIASPEIQRSLLTALVPEATKREHVGGLIVAPDGSPAQKH